MIRPLLPLVGHPELHHRLNPPQYAAFVLFEIDADYADGGMSEVLYYTNSKLLAAEAGELLREVGAPLHAEALANTNRSTWSGGQVPSDDAGRQRELGSPDQPQLHVSDAFWQNADQREGSLDSIMERFIRSHPDAFFY